MAPILDKLKTFDPFPKSIDHLSLTYSQFEKVRTNCSFSTPTQLKQKSKSLNQLSMLHLNVRSIVNKFDDFEAFLRSSSASWSIICMSETWLTKQLEPLYNLESYKAFFQSRTEKSAGGSAIYVKDNLKSSQLSHPPFTTAEVICIETQTISKQKIVICQIYRAPNSNKVDFLAEMETLLSWIHNLGRTTFINGDFNFDLFNIYLCHYSHDFFNLMCSYGFFPTISKTTRCCNTSCSLLDNIFCNNLNIIQKSGIIINDLSDHFPVYIFGRVDENDEQNQHVEKSQKITCFNYRQIGEMNVFLKENLRVALQEQDPDTIAETIIRVYNEGIQRYSFLRPQNRKNSPRKPWISPAILTSINRKK